MTEHQAKSITVFFPAFNDEATIETLVRRAQDVLVSLTGDFEIVVINDGSKDGTADVLAQLQLSIPFLRIVTHKSNRGYGGALRSGFSAATKELVFYTDGDGQYDVGELTKLYSEMGDDVDVVNGYKLNRADGVHRKTLGGLYARMTRLFFRLPIRDVDCDFRLIRRSMLDAIVLRSNSGAICVELVTQLASAGARFVEVGVRHYPRQAGRSQFFSVTRIFKTLVDLTGLWFRPARRINISTQTGHQIGDSPQTVK